MGKCSFKKEWLLKDDGNGFKVSAWAEKRGEQELLCKVCTAVVNFGSKGFQAITQHASSAKHKDSCRIKLAPGQLHISVGDSTSLSPSSLPNIRLSSVRDSATSAELIWVLKCVASNYSASSTSNILHVFQAMFPGLPPDSFSLSRTKMSYILTDALAPYFKEQLLQDMDDTLYSLCYDETTNAGGRKELQTTVRYWSKSKNRVVDRHLQSFFIGRATADDILEKIKAAIDNAGLSLHRLLMFGSDGPNVNKKVMRLMNEELKALQYKKLVDIGTCNIHTLHNAFLKGIKSLGEDASDLVIGLHGFFNDWPARWEDFEEIQEKLNLPNVHFIKHLSTRWLTIENSARRVLQQWKALQEYFLRYIPSKKPALLSSNNYKLIVKLLKTKTMKCELLFVCSTACIFTRFTGTFQRAEPLVHLLYSEMKTLLETLLGRVCKTIRNTTSDDIFNMDNLLPLKDIVCSAEVSAALSEFSELDKLHFLKRAQEHYISAAKHILKKAITGKNHLEYFRCLHPNARTSELSVRDIVNIAGLLPLQIQEDLLLDEWKLLTLEIVTENECSRIDDYWNQFIVMNSPSGNVKYPTVSKVVKSCLALSHGNVDVERRFSSSGRVLTDGRASMCERTLNAYLATKDVLALYDNKPELLPITRRLLTLAQHAHIAYNNYKEEKKKKEDDKKKQEHDEQERIRLENESLQKLNDTRKDISKLEEQLKEKRRIEVEKSTLASKLFSEANARLTQALKKKDLKEAEMANALLISVSAMRKEGEIAKKKADDIQSTINKRKNTLLNEYANKKKKM